MIKNSDQRKLEGQDLLELTNNPRYSLFEKFRKLESSRVKDSIKNRVGQSERAVLPATTVDNGPVILYRSMLQDKDPVERKKLIADKMVEDWHMRIKQRIISYRRMINNPEVSEIIENVSNEAICDNGKGQIISLEINDRYPRIAIGDVTKIKLQQDFNDLMQTVFNFDECAKDVFTKFLIEGAQFWEVCYNEEKNKIVGVNHLPSYNMLVIVDHGEVVGYRQILDNEYGGIDYNANVTSGKYNYIDYHVNQILYMDYGKWGMGGINDRMSYLEPAKKFVNVLGDLENAYAKYIIMRGQEKRVFYISTGKMNPAKAEEHMKRTADSLNRRMYYDSESGSVVGAERIQAMTDDYYVPLPDGSNASKIETLPAGQNIDKVTPLIYFREKIYQALKYPRNRSRFNTDGAQPSSIGKPGEIDVEQVVLTRFIENMQKKFGKLLIELFVMFLETRTDYDDIIKDPKLYTVAFEQSNVFKLIKESEMLNLRLDLLSKAQPFVTDHTGGKNDFFAKEYVMKDLVMMTDEAYSKNQELKDKEFIKFLRDKERLDELNKSTGSLGVPEDGEPVGGVGGGDMGMGGGELPPPDLGGEGEIPAPDMTDTGSPAENAPDLSLPEENTK
jgi:hypothetical protein